MDQPTRSFLSLAWDLVVDETALKTKAIITRTELSDKRKRKSQQCHELDFSMLD